MKGLVMIMILLMVFFMARKQAARRRVGGYDKGTSRERGVGKREQALTRNVEADVEPEEEETTESKYRKA